LQIEGKPVRSAEKRRARDQKGGGEGRVSGWCGWTPEIASASKQPKNVGYFAGRIE